MQLGRFNDTREPSPCVVVHAVENGDREIIDELNDAIDKFIK